MKTLLETKDDFFYINGGIFRELLRKNVFDWLTDVEQALTLDVAYYDGRSGGKPISPLYDRIINNNGEYFQTSGDFPLLTVLDNAFMLTTDTPPLSVLADTVIATYKQKWDKLYDTMVLSQYDALINKRITELRTPDLHVDEEGDKSISVSTSNEGTANEGVFGFNSATAVPSGESADMNVSTTTADAAGNITHYNRHTTGNDTTTAEGIEAEAIQDIIQKEINLLSQNRFLEIVFRDLDSVMVCPFYHLAS